MEEGFRIFAAIYLGATALSLMFQPVAWGELFQAVKTRTWLALLAFAAFSLIPGALLVAFHNVWDSAWIAVTILGWGLLIEGIAGVLAPRLIVDLYAVIVTKTLSARIIGVIFLLWAAFITGMLLNSAEACTTDPRSFFPGC